MAEKKKIYKPKPISGYPEWLPQIRRVEQQWLDHIRKVFESYGFCNIETPAVEALEVIAAKGEDVDKEIYVLERLQKEDGDKEARLALHFDQTVPLARYTAQNFNDLVFPFKRYQMQKVWRGERPQSGRFREFYQCDIDVINVDNLPLSFDAEMPAIIHEVLSGLDVPEFQIRISNRKILSSLVEAHIPQSEQTQIQIFRLLDKKEKLEASVFQTQLEDLYKAQFSNFPKLYNDVLAYIGYCDRLKTLNKKEQIAFLHELLAASNSAEIWPKFHEKYNLAPVKLFDHGFIKGLDEILYILGQLKHLPDNSIVADLSIVRGLDYYTGTVYETVFVDDPSYGSICSGGRYDDLASSYINKKLPGVGISIGFSRLFAKMQAQIEEKRISPADVLVILNSEEDRDLSAKTAKTLRERGMNVELYHAPQKFNKQMSYAEKKGIPFVWMPPFRDTTVHEVKNMATGEQIEVNPDEWKADA